MAVTYYAYEVICDIKEFELLYSESYVRSFFKMVLLVIVDFFFLYCEGQGNGGSSTRN